MYHNEENELIVNIDKLHTTDLGTVRIRRNLALRADDVVEWCKEKIQDPGAAITRKGKNWYVEVDGCIITVNAYSYTIITAHKKQRTGGSAAAKTGMGINKNCEKLTKICDNN